LGINSCPSPGTITASLSNKNRLLVLTSCDLSKNVYSPSKIESSLLEEPVVIVAIFPNFLLSHSEKSFPLSSLNFNCCENIFLAIPFLNAFNSSIVFIDEVIFSSSKLKKEDIFCCSERFGKETSIFSISDLLISGNVEPFALFVNSYLFCFIQLNKNKLS